MLNISKLVNAMNTVGNFDDVVVIECGSFTNTMIAAFDLNEADISASVYQKEVYSETIDKCILTVLEAELDYIHQLLEKTEDNIFVRAWKKFKEWMTSFWNWLTGKKTKSNDKDALEIVKGLDIENIFKDALNINRNEKKSVSDLIKEAQKEMDIFLRLNNFEREAEKKTFVSGIINKTKNLLGSFSKDEEEMATIMKEWKKNKDDYDLRIKTADKLFKCLDNYKKVNNKKLKQRAESLIIEVKNSIKLDL